MVKRLEHIKIQILKMWDIFIDFRYILEKRQKVFLNLLLTDCWSFVN